MKLKNKQEGWIMTNSSKPVSVQEKGSVSGFKVNFPARMHGYTEEEIRIVTDVMRNTDGLTQGACMRQFESDFKAYIGVNHAFAVDNCTNALHLSAILCRFKPGDEVIIPAYTFCATAIPFAKAGAKIVWADIDDTWTISPDDIEKKITKKTKAVVVVHLLGMPCDMDRIMAIAAKYKFRVIEDCAQAPGAKIGDRYVGSYGDFACFSFHSAKNITTLGEGGMLTVKNEEDAALVPGIRNNGIRAINGERPRYWVPAMSTVDLDIEGEWPDNFCIGEVQCALGSQLIKRLDTINDGLVAQGMKVREALKDTPEITFSRIPEGYKNIHHQFVMHFEGTNGKDRNDLMDITTTQYGIRNIVQYYPLYRFPLFQKGGFGEHDCPMLDKWWDNSFSFPWWCEIPDETIAYLADSTKAAIKMLKSK